MTVGTAGVAGGCVTVLKKNIKTKYQGIMGKYNECIL